ncbi:MAG TPA: hypothetical protein VHA75_08070 [Rugosimonospora sp.]|nr:hypothetical protein [Rugosimonospora sp.]
MTVSHDTTHSASEKPVPDWARLPQEDEELLARIAARPGEGLFGADQMRALLTWTHIVDAPRPAAGPEREKVLTAIKEFGEAALEYALAKPGTPERDRSAAAYAEAYDRLVALTDAVTERAGRELAAPATSPTCGYAWCTIGDHGSTPDYHATDVVSVIGVDGFVPASPVEVTVHGSMHEEVGGMPSGQPLIWVQPPEGESFAFDLPSAARLAQAILGMVATMGGTR